MTALDNGGSAFPIPAYTDSRGYVCDPEGGMTLRDYFAAKASEEDIQSLQHLIPTVEKMHVSFDGHKSARKVLPDNWRQIARYMHADAMIAAREVKP